MTQSQADSSVDGLEPYHTSDTPFAAYLHMMGMQVLSTKPDPNDHKRKVYIFLDEAERPEYERQFRNDEGGFKSYYTSLKIVQRYLYDK